MQPTVSLLVAMRNEAGYIERCLASIFAQDYSTNNWRSGCWTANRQMVLGRSSNGSSKDARIATYSRIRRSSKLPAGIWASLTLPVTSLVSSVPMLNWRRITYQLPWRRCNALAPIWSVVPCGPTARDAWGRAVALATSTPFGVGGARFHYIRREEEVDTVYMGLCWREVYRRIGGFDEEMVRNQDDELSYHLLQQGGRIICNPAIRSRYNNRSTFRSLWRQYFQYGYWKVRVMQKHPRQMRLRQFIPPAFVITALLGGALLAPYSTAIRHLWFLVLALYALANLAASLGTALKGQPAPPLPPSTCVRYITPELWFRISDRNRPKFWNRRGTRRTDSPTLRSTVVEADVETSKR